MPRHHARRSRRPFRSPRRWRWSTALATSIAAARSWSSSSTPSPCIGSAWVTLLSFGPILIVTALAIPALCRRAARPVGARRAGGDVVVLLFLRQRPRSPGRLCRLARRPLPVHVGRGRDRRAARIRHTPGRRPGSRLQWAAIAIALLAGLPTTIIDIYNTQDITNHSEAPGFHWTLMLRPDELQAFDWIQKNTRPDALFQVDPIARDSETWAYLPAFAERRMAIGLPISMVPLAKYQQGSEAIRHDLRGVAARGLRARRPRRGELRADRAAGARRRIRASKSDSIRFRTRCRSPSRTERSRSTKSDQLQTGDSTYFWQNAIKCQPSGRTSDRGSALKVPTNIVLNATPFQPLCRRDFTGKRSGTMRVSAKRLQQLREFARSNTSSTPAHPRARARPSSPSTARSATTRGCRP